MTQMIALGQNNSQEGIAGQLYLFLNQQPALS